MQQPRFRHMAKGTDKVYEVLKQRLVAGHYKPGTQLKEEPLAEEFGISRTPIRAVLKHLVDDGLATASPGKGIQVAAWTDWDVEEVFQLRLLLEPYAAYLAALRCPDGLVSHLEACNAAMSAALAENDPDMPDQVQEANSKFHHFLLEASQSQRVIGMLDTMIDMPVITRSFQIFERSDMEQSLAHHKDLTLAIAAQDGELARLSLIHI